MRWRIPSAKANGAREVTTGFAQRLQLQTMNVMAVSNQRDCNSYKTETGATVRSGFVSYRKW
jgi:hypothetical protein